MKYTALEVDDTEDEGLETIPEQQGSTTPASSKSSSRRPPPPSPDVANRRQERLLILASMAGFFMIVGALGLHNPETSTPDFTPGQGLRGAPGADSDASHAAALDFVEELDHITQEETSSSLLEKTNLYVAKPCSAYDEDDCEDTLQQESLFDDEDLLDAGTMSSWSEEFLDGATAESIDSNSIDDWSLPADSHYENADDFLEGEDVASFQDETLEEYDDDAISDDEGVVNETGQLLNSGGSEAVGGNYAEEQFETSIHEAARAEDQSTVARIEDESNHGH